MGIQSYLVDGHHGNGGGQSSVFLSKADVEQLPIFGRLATVAGMLFINRGSGGFNRGCRADAKLVARLFHHVLPRSDDHQRQTHQTNLWQIVRLSHEGKCSDSNNGAVLR